MAGMGTGVILGLLVGIVAGPWIVSNVKAIASAGEKKIGVTPAAGYYY